MQLIDQHTKAIMEECKMRARDAGLSFTDESLEYIVTNRNLVELSPKVMIPTLYDYWVHDVEVLKEQGKYKLYPHNPYETVINSRPPISFYNDNNPDWLNIMIFYHVIGHIDFFQNNLLFEKTWGDDFVGQALADKRLIESLRSEHGRWVDYVIEFARSIDNLVNYFDVLQENKFPASMQPNAKLSFYFDIFLQEILKLSNHQFFQELERYNKLQQSSPEIADTIFFADVRNRYPEFQAMYDKQQEFKSKRGDLLQQIIDRSPFLRKEENAWMRSVIAIIRETSLYFSPQIRSKICNEGWASYWHDELFRKDERIKGHEVAYAKLNAGVTSLSRVGLNPYAIGLRVFQWIEESANRGCLTYDFQKMSNLEQRENFDLKTSKGKETIFGVRSNFSDSTLINTFITQDFTDRHQLFVVGRRINQQKGVAEYFVQSRKAEDYKKMVLDTLYHPPVIKVNDEMTNDENLYLQHIFEGKQLVKEYITDTLIGIEYLYGAQVQLETTEIVVKTENGQPIKHFNKVLYTMKDRNYSKESLS